MPPIASIDIDSTLPASPKAQLQTQSGAVQYPALTCYDASDISSTTRAMVSSIERDGGIIVRNLIPQTLASQIRSEVNPYFDADIGDRSGFFPRTTQRATGLLGRSAGCVELACNRTWIDIANAILSSRYEFWEGKERVRCESKPIISSTVGFRVNSGGSQQALHRDDTDYHARNIDMPVMLGCVTALTKTTKENGATIVIPGSHLWSSERMPLDEEAVPVELEPGDALIFVGNLYHAGGANSTVNEARETVGLFMCKSYLRQAENQMLMVPPEKARHLPPQAQRLLGYGISPPAVGFVEYQDPMRVLFGVEDDETVDM